jgi:hypothetical protein
VNRYILKYENARVLSEESKSLSSNVEWMKETLASLREEDLQTRKDQSPQPVLDPESMKVLYSVLRFLGEMEEACINQSL